GHAGHGKGAAAASPGGQAGHASPTESLVLSSEQAALAGVRTARVDSLVLGSTASYRAVARLDDRSRENIPARVEGRIDQDRVLRAGERVRQGQVLAYLVSEPLQAAQEEYLLALRATKNLADPSLVRAQLQAARRRLEVMGMSQNQTGQLESRGTLFARLPILAPKDGLLVEVGVQPGQYVAAGTSLFTLGFSDRIWIETWLLAQEAQAYPEGTPALIHLQGMPGEPLAAKLDHIRRGTSEAGSVVLAHLAIPNPGNRILPGMEATVTFKSPGRRVLGVPASALIRSSSGAMVWLEAERNTYFPRMVRLGREGDGNVEVLDGLKAGERVVITGAYLLNSEWTLRKGAGKGHAGH
ncbi:MAG TPA: efflux RND transporter periplasmic adaptor subunit, partial [Fibrobacteria bacterium]|nr:efflux RND transporter periplasmic adaptor subunit [Fibrobacteria bacterium]